MAEVEGYQFDPVGEVDISDEEDQVGPETWEEVSNTGNNIVIVTNV